MASIFSERETTFDLYLESGDETFFTGNYSKVMPVNPIDLPSMQPGSLAREPRKLYWDFAHGGNT